MSTLKQATSSHVETDIAAPRTLAERAYLNLRQDVICGKLAPGEKLRVEHLKDQYQVGASTLREALSLLVSDALVSAEGQRGFRVAPISLTDLEDVTNTRVMLETEALRQSIRHGGAQWEAALRTSYQLLTQAEDPALAPEPQLWELRNKNFH
ncbi:MAG: GntR family transcriptional regulator, partial [Hydrogenophaga sp.]|nr:GntR family transcriptional regulator [Hydrogenophaga sp.]